MNMIIFSARSVAPRRVAKVGAAIALAFSVSGCFGALKSIGEPPTMSPVAGARKAIDPSLPRPGYDGDPYYVAKSAGGQGGRGIPKPRRISSTRKASSVQTASTKGARSASLYRGGASLYHDKRAREIGDPLTVIIQISDSASLSATSSRSRGTTASIEAPTVFGIEKLVDRIIPGDSVGLSAGASAGGDTSQSGTGSTARDESINARIAATVVDVLPNGYLVIAGTQEVRVNFELRDVQVVGVVRPSDISRDNTVTHDRIASARISIGGDGPAFDVTGQTYGEVILDKLRPF